MVRIHNPVPSNKAKKKGSDNQLHGGMLESADQVSDLINKASGNDNQQNTSNKNK